MDRDIRRRLLVLAAFTAAVIALWVLAGRYLPLERIAAQEQELRRWTTGRPVLAFTIGFVVYTLVSLFPGTSGKSVACGWLFGFWQGMAMVTVALTVAALVGFSIARYALHDVLHHRFGTTLARIDRGLERDGAFYLLTLRMLHTPYTVVNYASGACRIDTWTFAWTTWVGLVPGTIAFVGVGAGLPTLDELLEEGPLGLLSPPLVVALALMGGLPWLVRTVIRRVRPGSEPTIDLRGSGGDRPR
ncbi:MAG TPA: VTT domain-containing protein [Thermoanaerobaculia bacterium]|nr:VTT domain-containing protein [Thermoanaerobaculia bacterium]